MVKVVKTQTKDTKFVFAVSAKDKLNTEKKKVGESFEKEGNIYYVFADEAVTPDFYASLEGKLKGAKDAYSIDLDSFLALVEDESLHCTLITIITSAVEFTTVTPFTMKTKPVELKQHEICATAQVQKDYKVSLEKNTVVAESVTFARKLQDTPSSIMNPECFVKEVKALFKGVAGVKIKEYSREELQKKKMGLLLAVGQGTDVEAEKSRMLVVEYKKNDDCDELYAYVGKGVCFDAGGMNIKTGSHMKSMKFDMSGAAVVAATVYALAKNKSKTNVVAVMPLVVNAVSEIAVRPDDIMVSYSGKTVEMDNTDAEGRLILADAITFAAKDVKATSICTVATLTGAMRYALGNVYTGLWTSNKLASVELVKRATEAGEHVWAMPMHDVFTSPLMRATKVADITNSCNDPNAGSSRAAGFLNEFALGVDFNHFDFASTAEKDGLGQGALVKTLYKNGINQTGLKNRYKEYTKALKVLN